MVATAADTSLARAEWQGVLFAPRPQRRELLTLQPSWPTRPVRLRVHRNHAFEPVASVLPPYLAFAGYGAELTYSSYDDSLAFATPGPADVDVVWLDFSRYETTHDAASLARWIVQRLAALRATGDAPILIPDYAEDSDRARRFNEELRAMVAAVPGAYVCDQASIAAGLGAAYTDARAAAVTGTRLSNLACIHTARALGSAWLPAVLSPRLKAVVLDLDNTLYEGVLGEDGPDGVRLTADHAALQRRVVALGGEGMFLALCSRNEAADVHELFARRADFPLRPEQLSVLEISWDHKAAAIRRIAESLRIGTDAVLFVDDNPGELAAVQTELPEVKTLYAGPTARDALDALSYYPGLHRLRSDETDALRAADLHASRERERLAAGSADPGAYLRSLGVRLDFARDRRAELERLAELSNKTNQFNLSLRRLSAADVAEFIDGPDRAAVSVRLSDRLSDSGIVGAVFLRREDDGVAVDELCISCRALGRQLEDIMVAEAVRVAAGAFGVEPRRVSFHPVQGPRNKPALEWLDRFAGAAGARRHDGSLSVPWDAAAVERRIEAAPITINHQGRE